VIRWHREGFRLLWKHRSKATTLREWRLAPDTIELIKLRDEWQRRGIPGARRSPPCVPVGGVTRRITKGACTYL
jgi:hypothetical protein